MVKKIAVGFFSLLLMHSSLSADPKWIPIEPINFNESTKKDTNLSQIKPSNNLLENVKILQQLLDKTKEDEKLDDEEEKNWYPL